MMDSPSGNGGGDGRTPKLRPEQVEALADQLVEAIERRLRAREEAKREISRRRMDHHIGLITEAQECGGAPFVTLSEPAFLMTGQISAMEKSQPLGLPNS